VCLAMGPSDVGVPAMFVASVRCGRRAFDGCFLSHLLVRPGLVSLVLAWRCLRDGLWIGCFCVPVVVPSCFGAGWVGCVIAVRSVGCCWLPVVSPVFLSFRFHCGSWHWFCVSFGSAGWLPCFVLPWFWVVYAWGCRLVLAGIWRRVDVGSCFWGAIG